MRKGHRRGWESGSNWKPVTLNSLTFATLILKLCPMGLMRLKLMWLWPVDQQGPIFRTGDEEPKTAPCGNWFSSGAPS